jgi:hypothetical protein
LSGKFSFVVTARLDTRIEWCFFVYKMHVTVTNVSPREYFDLVASIRSSPVDCCGCAVVLHVGGTSMLSFWVLC